MSDIEKLQKALDTAMSRIASLEAQTSRPKPAADTFNFEKFRKELTADPLGTMKKMQVPVEHVRNVMVADTFRAHGVPVPPQLEMLANMGPQAMAAQAHDDRLEQLSRQVQEMKSSETNKGKRESLKTTVLDKSKYPNLAKAFAADPALIEGDLDSHTGSVEEFVAAKEAQMAKVAAALGIAPAQTASTESAVDNDESNETVAEDQSKQVKPAGTASFEAPVVPKPLPGSWSKTEHERIKAEILNRPKTQ